MDGQKEGYFCARRDGIPERSERGRVQGAVFRDFYAACESKENRRAVFAQRRGLYRKEPADFSKYAGALARYTGRGQKHGGYPRQLGAGENIRHINAGGRPGGEREN